MVLFSEKSRYRKNNVYNNLKSYENFRRERTCVCVEQNARHLQCDLKLELFRMRIVGMGVVEVLRFRIAHCGVINPIQKKQDLHSLRIVCFPFALLLAVPNRL